MNPHKTAFLWGLHGFFGCVVGYVLAFVMAGVGLSVAGFLGLAVVYLVAAAVIVLPGVVWGMFLGSWKLAAAGAAAHGVVVIALYLVALSGALDFLQHVLPTSSRVGFAVHAGMLLGVTWYLTGLGAGALLGQMTGASVCGQRVRGWGRELVFTRHCPSGWKQRTPGN